MSTELNTYRPDASRIDNALDMRDREVGNTDGLDLARVEELDHCLPCIHEARRRVKSNPASLAGVLGLEVRRTKRNRWERNGPVNDCTGAYTLIKPDRTGEKRREWHSR